MGLGADACRPPALHFNLLHRRVTLPVVTLVYFSSTTLSTATAPLYSASNSFFLLLFFLSGAGAADALDDAMSLTISHLTIFLSLFLSFLVSPNTTRAQQFLLPPTIPLAVRSPNLNCWLQYNHDSRDLTIFSGTWPTTSNHSQVCHPHAFYWP